MSNPFAAPAASTGITWADHLGKLMLIEPSMFETGIQTSLGEKDAVRADVSVITGIGEAEVYEDCLIFPRVLIGQLRPRIGEKVLGRLTQGQAKSGQSAPWMIQEATPEDIEKGVAYLNARGTKQVSQPAAANGSAPATEQPGTPAPEGATKVPF